MKSKLVLIVSTIRAAATFELLSSIVLKISVLIPTIQQWKLVYLLLVQSESIVTGESLVTDVTFIWLDAWMQLDMLLQIVISTKLQLVLSQLHWDAYLVKRDPQIWQTWGLGTVVGSVRRRTDWYWPFSGNAGKSGWVRGLPVRVRPTMAPGGGM